MQSFFWLFIFWCDLFYDFQKYANGKDMEKIQIYLYFTCPNITFFCPNINAFLYFPKSFILLSSSLLIAPFTAQLHINSPSSIWYLQWMKQESLETWDVTEQLRIQCRYRKCKSNMKAYIWRVMISKLLTGNLYWRVLLLRVFGFLSFPPLH